MRKFLLTFILPLAFAPNANAQWTEDSSVNTRVTPSNLIFYEPNMLTNQDGTTYFFFVVPTQLPNGDDAFQYRMQIYTPEGQRVYGAAGKVIAGERNITYTKFGDYITLDNDGNCIVACYDLRDAAPGTYTFNYYIYKVNPAGDIVWGPVALNGGQGDENITGLSLCATDDGGTALAYSASGETARQRVTHLERLDKDGQPLWQQPVVIEPQSKTQRPFVVNNGKNEVMVLYQNEAEEFVARVFDAEGSDVWGEAVELYTGGFSTDRVYNCIDVQSGPDGGVVFSVMDGNWDGRFIYMTREGEYAFPTANVGTIAAGPDYQSTVPSVCYDPDEQVFYVAFKNMAYYGYDGYGVNVQKFTLKGQRLWGDEGIAVLPTEGGQQVSGVTLRPAGEGRVAVFYQYMASSGYNDPVGTYFAIIDKDGNVVHEPNNVTTSEYTKNNLAVSPLINDNHYIISWTEQRSNSTKECIFAQYVNIDGTTADGIEDIRRDATDGQRFYDLQGRQLAAPSRSGISIVRSNGQTRTIINNK